LFLVANQQIDPNYPVLQHLIAVGHQLDPALSESYAEWVVGSIKALLAVQFRIPVQDSNLNQVGNVPLGVENQEFFK